MRKFTIISVLLITFAFCAHAQEKRPTNQKFEYFLNIQGGTASKTDIAAVENLFHSKAVVTYFETNKISHKYFVMRSSVPVNKTTIEGWLSGTSYQLLGFAEDIRDKESLVKQLH